MTASTTVHRHEVSVDGTTLSFLHAGAGPPVLLVHGTFWSRVWKPVMGAVAASGHEVFALDFPGFGASGGRLARHGATVPALAGWVRRFLGAVGAGDRLVVGGHDIGGAVAQHLAPHLDADPRAALERMRAQGREQGADQTLRRGPR